MFVVIHILRVYIYGVYDSARQACLNMRLPKSHILFPSADSQGHLLVSWQPGPTKIAQDAAKGVSKIAPWVVVCFTVPKHKIKMNRFVGFFMKVNK